MPKLKIALGFATTFTAGVVLATTAQARDLAVVSWGGAYLDAQK
jgi:putative spermidine/putrescine transport system substrate-binding protein